VNNIPDQLKKNVINAHGDKGQQWLDSLPQQIAKYAKQWELAALKPVDNMSYNYVLKATQNGHPVVMKLGLPQAEFLREMECLAYYNGVGAPTLIANDTANGAMLMECMIPGTTLKRYFPQEEEASLAIAAAVIQQLQSVKIPKDTLFPNIEQWHASLNATKPTENIPEELLTTAKELSKHLIATQTTTTLLHADLHHDNILLGEDEKWLAIDPKGIIGEPAYELGAFIRNPLMELRQQTNIKGILSRRADAFAQYLDLNRDRIVQWSFVQAVLSACWSMEENNMGNAESAINSAKLLSEL